jgi:uncharacterized protein YndB with AHSA1/START domain
MPERKNDPPKMHGGTHSVTVTRHFDFPSERVFDAWLDPGSARKWLFATDTGKVVRVEIDPRVGGRFSIVDRRDGEDVEHCGEYLEIDRPHRLVFTFAVPKYSDQFSTVAIEIIPRGSGCELTLRHDGILPEYLEATPRGWTRILEALVRTIEGSSR